MKTLALAAIVTIASVAGQAQAAVSKPMPMRQAGTLTCSIEPGLGLVVGSARGVACSYSFYDRKGRPVRESYAGSMTRAGFDVGLTSGQTVSWSVFTAGGFNRRGMMSGAFAGASSDASIVVGAGTHALLGQGRRAISLEPLAASGQVGFGVGFGATGLDLQRARPATFTGLFY